MADTVSVDSHDDEIVAVASKRGGWGRVFKITVSVTLIAVVLRQTNFRDIAAAFAVADIGLLAFAGSLTFVGAFLTASRWRVLLKAQAVSTTTGYLFRCWMVACFFNQFLPSTIGGDARRIYDSWKLGATKTGAVAAIGVDRILGLIALMMYGVVALYISTAFFERQTELRIFVVGIAVVLVTLAALIFMPKTPLDAPAERLVEKCPKLLRKIIGKFRPAVVAYRGEGRIMATALLLSVALQLNVITFYFLIGKSLGMELDFLDYMIVVPVASVVLLLPVTINGIGLREGVFVLLLGGFAVASPTAIAFAWASFALFLMFGLLGGVMYAVQKIPDSS